MSAMKIAVSGIHAAEVRMAASAHNLANLTTRDFHPLRVTQRSSPAGGVEAEAFREPAPREVDVARELVDQMLAATQLEASLRVIATGADVRGSLLDLFA